MDFPPLNTESGEKRNSKMHCRKLQDSYNVSFKIEIKTQSYKYTVSLIKVWNEKGNDFVVPMSTSNMSMAFSNIQQ